MEERKPKEVTNRLTWTQFQIEWQRLIEDPYITVEQLVNALYLAGEVPFSQGFVAPSITPLVDQTVLAHEVLMRGQFFLAVARGEVVGCEGAQITAAQRFVTKVLAQAQIPPIPVGTQRLFLEFFGRPISHFGLATPPYPRFVQAYLGRVHQWWMTPCQSFHNSTEQNQLLYALHQNLQSQSDLLIPAMCNWGMAGDLVRGGNLQLVVKELGLFLRGKEGDFKWLIRQHCRTLPPLHDFTRTSTGLNGVKECRMRVALALAALSS